MGDFKATLRIQREQWERFLGYAKLRGTTASALISGFIDATIAKDTQTDHLPDDRTQADSEANFQTDGATDRNKDRKHADRQVIADLTRRLEVLESLVCKSVRIEEEETYQPERVFVPDSELVTDPQTDIQTGFQTDTAGSPNAATAVEGYVADIITRLLVAAYDGFDAIQSEATYGIELVATSAVSEIQLEAIVGIELVRDVALEEIEQLEAECDRLALEKQSALDGLQAYSDECGA